MGASAKCTTIRHIVRLRQMLRRWRERASTGGGRERASTGGGRGGGSRVTPSDVPEGHFAVRVGSRSRRFVVRTSYLNHPVFKKLLVEAEEVYGYDHPGPIAIPCDENVFEEILRFLSTTSSKKNKKYLSMAAEGGGGGGGGCGNAGVRESWHDSSSFPLLRGFEVEHAPVVPINV